MRKTLASRSMFVMAVDASVTSHSTMPLATLIFFVPCESKGDKKANKFGGRPLWSDIPFNFTKHILATRYVGFIWYRQPSISPTAGTEISLLFIWRRGAYVNYVYV